ncbi:unnamed protein product, partial [marine sediment metagenome]
RYFEGAVPEPGDPGDAEQPVLSAAEDLRTSAPEAMAECRFHVYLDKILGLTGATNVYIDRTEPFKLAKDPSQRERLGTILYTCAEAVRIILMYLAPVMPTAAPAGLDQLGWKRGDSPLEESGRWGVLPPGTKTVKGEALFPRKQ